VKIEQLRQHKILGFIFDTSPEYESENRKKLTSLDAYLTPNGVQTYSKYTK
jgi:hypothetical protein